MSTTHMRAPSTGRSITVIAALALAGSAACVQAQRRSQVSYVAVRMDLRKLDSAAANRIALQIVSDGRGLNSDFVTAQMAPGAVDEQRLMLGTTCPGDCRYGPRVTIEPHRNNHRINSAQRDSGVILARLINKDTTSYPKFNIHGRDTVYWWVRIRDGDSVSVFASTRPGMRAAVRDLHASRHAPGSYGQALARWLWTDRDEDAWVTCDGGMCCRSTGQEFQ